MIYDYDFATKIIDIPLGTTAVDVQDLINDIRDAEATAVGIRYGQIASASGKESLDGAVSVGITVNLLDDWQIRFAEGNYIAKVSGGNLVGGLNGDPIAYSAGVQVLLVQSAASTVVTTSDGLSAGDRTLLETAAANDAEAVWDYLIEAGLSAQEVMRIKAAALAGKASGASTGTVTFKGIDGTTDRIIADVDEVGNRTTVSVDGA